MHRASDRVVIPHEINPTTMKMMTSTGLLFRTLA
jgi:hypothetical protein